MRTITATESITLDGVMQAPGGADEDTRGGFRHGGWARPYVDHVMGEALGAGKTPGGPLLFGRRTYQRFASFWPQEQDGPDIGILGSGTLVGSLLDHGLIDRLVLLIHPLVLGGGQRLFPAEGPAYGLELVSAITTTTGVIIATMRPSETTR